jgi:hypothetical protein
MVGSHQQHKGETALVAVSSGATTSNGIFASTSTHNNNGMRWLEASKYHRVVGLAAGGTHSLLHT